MALWNVFANCYPTLMWRRLLLLASLLSLVSCATVMTGNRENIVISSEPSGADAALVCNGKPAGSGVTPTTISIRRNAGDCDLRLTKEGFEDLSFLIEQGVNPAYWTNMFFAPLAGLGVVLVGLGDSDEKALGAASLAMALAIFGIDFHTGAIHDHEPRTINAILKPRAAPPP